MDRDQVMEAAKTVTGQLDTAQEMYRKGQSELCLAYLETVIAPGPVYWYASITLMCQGIVMETPVCDCVRHGREQCYQVGVTDQWGRPLRDPLYEFSTEIITVFSQHDWEGYTDRLGHVAEEGRASGLLSILLARFTQLQDMKAAGQL
jgi:hypothetical protein